MCLEGALLPSHNMTGLDWIQGRPFMSQRVDGTRVERQQISQVPAHGIRPLFLPHRFIHLINQVCIQRQLHHKEEL